MFADSLFLVATVIISQILLYIFDRYNDENLRDFTGLIVKLKYVNWPDGCVYFASLRVDSEEPLVLYQDICKDPKKFIESHGYEVYECDIVSMDIYHNSVVSKIL